MNNRYEYIAKPTEEGYIKIPASILKKLKDAKLKISIEKIKEKRKNDDGEYSFAKVREVTKSIKGEISKEVIKEREERI